MSGEGRTHAARAEGAARLTRSAWKQRVPPGADLKPLLCGSIAEPRDGCEGLQRRFPARGLPSRPRGSPGSHRRGFRSFGRFPNGQIVLEPERAAVESKFSIDFY
jgi:hypothetical protein